MAAGGRHRTEDVTALSTPGQDAAADGIAIVALGHASPAAHFRRVAALHASELRVGLLAQLGEAFLSDFYCHVATDADSVLLAAIERGEVAGFVSGTRDIGAFYRRYVLRRTRTLALHLLPHLLRGRVLARIFSLRRYLVSREARQDLPASELTSIAVDPRIARKGVGRALFAAFRRSMRERGIAAFRVSAATTQVSALQFYPALGARRVASGRLGGLELVIFVCDT